MTKSYFDDDEIQKKYNILIVRKSTETMRDDLGSVKVLFWLSENDIFPLERIIFPINNQIFIKNGFSKIKNDNRNNIYKLTNYKRSDFWGENSDKNKYVASSESIEYINKLELIPIITIKDFNPNPSYPYIDNAIDKNILVDSETLLISNNEYIYGPFYINDDDDIIKINPLRKADRIYKEQYNFIYKIKFETIKDNIKYYDDIGYIYNIKNIIQNIEYETLDFISDDDLLKWGSDEKLIQQKENRPSRKEEQKWIRGLDSLKKNGKLNEINKNRKERLIVLLGKIVENDAFGASLSSSIIEAIANNKNLIDEYIDKHQEIIIDKVNEKTAEIIKPLKTQKNKLEEEIKNLRHEKDELNKEIELKSSKKLEEKNKDLIISIEKNEEKLHSLKEELGTYKELKDIKSRITDEENKLKVRREDLENIKLQIKTLRSEDLKKELISLQTKLDVINGILPYYNEEIINKNNEKKAHINYSLDDYSSANEYISTIYNYFNDIGRSTSYNDIANILVCIFNSFLTIFTGQPGSGKTSTVKILAKALGLADSNAFLEIPVSRGWTSSKDFIGYHNPLTGRFQDSTTGIYKFLKNISDNNAQLLNLILLDEANLSPIEHYWANFLIMCDTETKKQINIDSKNEFDVLDIDESLRFIATINNDATTERLSPRLIDRAAIIQLHNNLHFIDNNNINIYDNHPIGAVPYSKLKSMFTPNTVEFTSEESEYLKRITDALSGNESEDDYTPKVILSNRKIFAIKKYCSLARDLFDDSNPLEYFDYAISEFILPLIEGYGEDFNTRLKKLLKAIDKFPKSSFLLKDILGKGENAHHYYSYF